MFGKVRISLWMILFLPLAVIFGGVTMVTAYAAAIFFHELCHIVAAKILGFQVDEMVIMPLGASANIIGLEEADSKSEFLIAIAGPCGSMALVIFALAAGRYFPGREIELFAQINMMLAGFNLLPGLPLDGGRCVRAVLRTFMDRGRANTVAAVFGFLLGCVFSGLGIFYALEGNIIPSALSIGFFLIISSLKERKSRALSLYSAITRREGRLRERKIIDVKHIAVHRSTEVSRVAGRFSPNKYHIITVLGGDRRVTLTEDQLLNAIMSGKGGTIGGISGFNEKYLL